jgi:hypothetical protein
MTATTIADPFALSHEDIAEQLEPFCDGALDRFSDPELLYAYDLATAWAHDLLTAEAAACSIAAEWLGRHGRNIPRISADVALAQFAELAAQFDTSFWQLDPAE